MLSSTSPSSVWGDRQVIQAAAAASVEADRPAYASSAHFWAFCRGEQADVSPAARDAWLRLMDRQFGPRYEQLQDDAREAGYGDGCHHRWEPPLHGKYETEMRRCHVEHPLGLMDLAERASLELLVDSVRGEGEETHVRHLYSPVRGAVPNTTAQKLLLLSQVRWLAFLAAPLLCGLDLEAIGKCP